VIAGRLVATALCAEDPEALALGLAGGAPTVTSRAPAGG
jgi:hypothetical protein